MPRWIDVISFVLLGVIFFNGLLNLINPKMMWKTFEGWKATGEPSNTFFIMRRIGGAAAVLAVVCLLLLPWILSR